jgi:N-acetylmuramoyl-L-alanine amidase
MRAILGLLLCCTSLLGGWTWPSWVATTPATLLDAVPEPSSCGITYVVRAGDTLSAIAARCGVPLNNVLASNRLSVLSRVSPGQRLALPAVVAAKSSARAAMACGNPYVVRGGDSLTSIATRCGTTSANLVHWNHLRRTSVYVGQWLLTRGPSVGAGNDPEAAERHPAVVASPTPRFEPPVQP